MRLPKIDSRMMMKQKLSLSALTVKTVVDKPDLGKYSDHGGKGLYLLVERQGVGRWQRKFRWLEKEKVDSLGSYPVTTLAEARRKADESYRMVVSGINPVEHRRALKAAAVKKNADTLELVAKEWFIPYSSKTAASTSAKVWRRLEMHFLDLCVSGRRLGSFPVGEVGRDQILHGLRKLERTNYETAKRLLITCGQLFAYAVRTGRRTDNPCTTLSDDLMARPSNPKHRPAITDPVSLGACLRKFDQTKGR